MRKKKAAIPKTTSWCPLLWHFLLGNNIRPKSKRNNNNSHNNNNKSINCNFEKTELLDISCCVPQGSILGPLLLYINYLCLVSQFLKPIMFADDTNLFCSNKEIKPLFLKTSLELGKISEWFRAKKLSLNEDKTRFTLFKMENKGNGTEWMHLLKQIGSQCCRFV